MSQTKLATLDSTGNVPLGQLGTLAHPLTQRNLATAANRQIDPNLITPLASDTTGVLQTVPTGYAGNDVVEPTILFDATAPFLGYEYVLCVCGYYQSNAIYENAGLWVSHNGTTWIPVVNGVPTPGYGGQYTPIFPNGSQGDGNASDGGLFRGPDGTYYLLWNQFLNATPTGTGTGGNNWSVKISKASSLAGPWSTPVNALATIAGTTRPSSPSMFWDGATWHMYGVDNNNTSATILMHYTNPNADPTTGAWTIQTAPAATIPEAYASQDWWHLNAYLCGSQHVLLIQDTQIGTSGGGNTWVVTSDDGGTTWTVPSRPWVPSTSTYRGCLIFSGDGADVFYGRLGSGVWELRRAHLSITGPSAAMSHSGVIHGFPLHALAVAAARVPIAPYVLGDVPGRADSSTVPGTADSGQAFTTLSGTVGISGKQFYAPSGGNSKATVTTTVADGVTSFTMAVAPSSQAWGMCRIVDGNNFVRFGFHVTYGYRIENIVAAAVSQSVSQTGPIVAPPAGTTLTLLHVGGTVKLYVGGAKVCEATGWTTNKTATGAGVQFNDATARLCNLTQRALVNGA